MDFTQEKIQQIKNAYEKNSDSTYTSIAKIFGTSRKVVARILKLNGVKPKTPVKPIQVEKTISLKSKCPPQISLETKEIEKTDPEQSYKRAYSFIVQKIPDVSEQFRNKIRKSEIHFVGIPKGVMTDNCIYDAIFNDIYFFKSYHDIISWFREYIKQAIKGTYEDELNLIEIYINGKRMHPKYELHVSFNLDENVKEELVFEHNRISTM